MKKSMIAQAIALVCVTGIAQAHTSYFWEDGSGHFVKDGSGHCVRTIDWVADHGVAECGGAAVAKPAPVVKSAPAPKAAKPASVAKPAPAAKKPAVRSLSLASGALFASGSAQLGSAGVSEIDKLADQLKQMDDVEQITISGHTDSRGAAAFNQSISEQRAATVKEELIKRGIDGNKIVTRGYGETQPVASNDDPVGRQKNRRVEIEVKGKKIIQ